MAAGDVLPRRLLSERLDEWLEVRDCRRLLDEAWAERGASPPTTGDDVPLVSVCIPTYVRDRELLLRGCVPRSRRRIHGSR